MSLLSQGPLMCYFQTVGPETLGLSDLGINLTGVGGWSRLAPKGIRAPIAP
jgi:hypothetical protein